VDYTISLEPHGRRWLFGLDMPAGPFPGDAILNRQFQLLAMRPINERQAYSLRSYLDYRSTRLLSASYREHFSRLPPGSNEQSSALARAWYAQASSDRDYISRVLEMFRVQPFVYTLSPLPLDMRNPNDDFLFNTREGFCEYYASAFAVLMRSVGIPARIVTGYQGGELNRLGQYLIVRQSSAHAWVEVWLDDAGWVRVDPTAAVAPERVRLGLSEALRAGDPVPGGLLRSNALLSKLRMAWDTVNAGWNNWVLGYGPKLQMEFLAKFGLHAPSAVQLVAIIAAVSFLLLGLLTLWLAGRYRPRSADPALILYRRFLARLQRAGLSTSPHEGPRDLAARIRTLRPDLADQATEITRHYIAARYQESNQAFALDALSQSVAGFRPARRRL
jgi:transglutaminase-like putative cysteine protease